jgi:hypothetical protein
VGATKIEKGNGPGDRLDLAPGTAHAATVGQGGVTCVEAARG